MRSPPVPAEDGTGSGAGEATADEACPVTAGCGPDTARPDESAVGGGLEPLCREAVSRVGARRLVAAFGRDAGEGRGRVAFGSRRRARRRSPEPLDQVLDADGAVQVAQAQQQEFDQDARLAHPLQAALRLEIGRHRQHAHQIGGLEVPCARFEGGSVLAPCIDGFLAVQADAQEQAQTLHQTVIELHQVVSLVHERLDEGKDIPVTVPQDDVEELEEAFLLDEAEHLPHRSGGDVTPGERQNLVEKRERVAHAPIGLARDDAQRFGGGPGPFAFDHLLQPGDDVGHAEPPEVEPLAAREDG